MVKSKKSKKKSKMTMLEKVEAFKRVQDYTVDIKNRLEEIVKSTYDFRCSAVNDFNVKGNFIMVYYDRYCRGESCSEWVKIPVEWLAEGFDYEAAYKRELEKTEIRRKREEAAEKRWREAAKKAAALEKEKRERELYFKLREKYEREEHSQTESIE